MSGYLREILIGARQTGRTKQQIYEMLDRLKGVTKQDRENKEKKGYVKLF